MKWRVNDRKRTYDRRVELWSAFEAVCVGVPDSHERPVWTLEPVRFGWKGDAVRCCESGCGWGCGGWDWRVGREKRKDERTYS
jgi:hypothetical protein